MRNFAASARTSKALPPPTWSGCQLCRFSRLPQPKISKATPPGKHGTPVPCFLVLCDPNRVRFVEPENLMRLQREFCFWIDNLLAVQLHASLLDYATHIGAGFLDAEALLVCCHDHR